MCEQSQRLLKEYAKKDESVSSGGGAAEADDTQADDTQAAPALPSAGKAVEAAFAETMGSEATSGERISSTVEAPADGTAQGETGANVQ